MGTEGKSIASVVRFFRKFRGGSQPILAEATNGLCYVVKFKNNLQGTNLLFNESAGAELYRACGLPVPEWGPLLVTDAFLSHNRACWMETPEGPLRPASGLCFGSRFLGGGSARLFEVVPGTSIGRVRNLQDFWLAWLVDVCALHADNRQAIFQEDSTRQLNAFFVDHGHMFGGPNGEQRLPFQASRYLDGRIYPRISPQLAMSLQKVACNLHVDELWRRIQALPDEWKTDSALRSFAQCVEKLAAPGLFPQMLDSMVNSLRVMGLREYDYLQRGKQLATSVLRPRIQGA